MASFTTFPQVDAMPHFAPPFGAMPIPTGGAVSDLVQQATGSDFLGPAALGIGTSTLAGGFTGGLAAGSWRGAAIGAGVNAGLWSLFTLFGSWRTSDRVTRWVLGGTAAVGLVVAGGFVYSRWRRKRARLAGRK